VSDPKTPAPPRDRIKGSRINPKGSARSAASGRRISISAATEKALRKKAAEHEGVTLGALKSVWRRGAGAYSTSHRPGVPRSAWAMARVNAFLFLVRNGYPKNPNYVQDNDLLPKGTRKTKRKRGSSHIVVVR